MAPVMNKPLYTVEILRLAASIPYLRRLDHPQGRAEVRSPTCGSTALVEVTLDADGRVAALGQRVEACAFGQASAAVMGAAAPGADIADARQALKELTDWLDGKGGAPGDWPGLAALAPARSRRARHGAILLPFRALVAAIDDAAGRSGK